MGFIYTDDGTGEKEECDFQDESADTEHSVITRDEVERTKAALLLLSPALQDAVNLVCLCGYSCAEAARILHGCRARSILEFCGIERKYD